MRTNTSKKNSSVFWVVGGLLAVGIITVIYFSFMKKDSFTVTFDTDGGNVITEQVVKEGEKATRPDDPKRSGYTFDNWYLNGSVYDFDTVIKENTILNAKWILEVKNGYKVTFDTDGGSTIASVAISEGGKVTSPTVPTKKGYDFVEWQLDEKKYDFDTVLTKDITLKAVWKENAEIKDLTKYTVTFDSNGGSSVSKQTIVEGNTAQKPANPTKNGYNFVAWQLNGSNYSFSSKVTKNITLKAKWEAKVRVTVTFNSDGGTTVDSKTLYKGDKLGTVTSPTKSGFTFDGWMNGNTKYTAATIINNSITLTAKWLNNDEIALTNAKNGVRPYTITKGGDLTYTATGCSAVVTPAESVSKVTRGTADRNINVSIAITCGSASGTATTTATIKKSTYQYTAVPSGNQTTTYVRIAGLTDYKLYKTGTTNIIGSYYEYCTGANISNANIESHPNIDMVIDSDLNTVYAVTYTN